MARAFFILALLTVLPAGLQAQTLRGRLVESAGGAPIKGAFVLLYPATGDASPEAPAFDAALTAADGRFTLSAPRPGAYRLRVDRIGYQSHLAGPFEVAAAGVVETTIAIPVAPIEIPAITARVESPCEIDASTSERFGGVWEEARKALATALWSEREGIYRITATTYERVMYPQQRIVDSRDRVRDGLRRDSPYLGLSAADLDRLGYVQFERDAVRFYAPDAEALLSDVFLEGHCFRLVPGERENLPGWIGLAFEPIRGRRIADVEGVIWIDRATSELRRLDLGYTGIPDRLARHLPEGRIEFESLPTGAWIIRRWWIRAPLVAPTEPYDLVGHTVTGGEVTRIATPSDETIATWGAEAIVRPGGVLSGIVTTPTGRALPDAVVSAGTVRQAVDEEGRFRIEGLTAGRYRLRFTTPRLSALGWASSPLVVELLEDGATELTFVAPSDREVAAALCPNPRDLVTSRGQRRAVATGVLRVAGSDSLPEDATVIASWGESSIRVAPVGENGRYVLCGLPVGGRVFLRASAGTHVRRFELDIPPGTAATAFDLALP
jgi:hypothetical protein